MPSNSSPILGFGIDSAGTGLRALPPLSLYIHIPWCIKKCPYCDFNSHEVKPAHKASSIPVIAQQHAGAISLAAMPEAQYVDALIADLEHTLPNVWGRRITSIFFGGGTPSVFSAESIDRILGAVRARLVVDAEAEITLEANPGTFEIEKFKGFRDAGVNRLSIGIQSFNAQHLHALGRVHNDDEAKRAIAIAQQHFDNINLDLMFALPNQTLAECAQDVETALAFGTNHLSIYHLTLEPNTLFHRFPPPLPDDELAADLQEMIFAKLSQAGYTHYETSAYAKPGHESKHNLNYWQFGDYIGIGAGAHGKISFPDARGITREMRYKQPKSFMEHAMLGAGIQEHITVSARDLPFEFMMNALRLNDGFPIALFVERTGLPINTISRELGEAESRGLLQRDHVHIAATKKGRMFLNDLLGIFLREAT
jgi:putative oxygen-independent coproporphyrinogen III oxidase